MSPSAVERPLHRSVCRPFGDGRRKSLSRRLADIFATRTGIWYDPQDLTTLFQDAQGTLPVYRPGTGLVDPPVGLMLDKSGGGYHASQSTTTARPTLSGRYNLLTATETLSTQSVTTVATNYTLSFDGTGTITLSGKATGTYSAGTHTIPCTAGTLTCTVAGSVTRADLRVKRDGSDLPAYQSVTDADNYDTAGFPLFLKRDKVDDDLICQVPTGGITGAWAHGTIDGPMFGTVAIPAGEYHPFGTKLNVGLPDCTQWIAIDGALSASEQAVFERYVYSKARQLIDVKQFGHVRAMVGWLRERADITSIDLTRTDLSNVTNLSDFLRGAENITELDLSGTNLQTAPGYLAPYASKLETVNITGLTFIRGQMIQSFVYCSNLTTIKLDPSIPNPSTDWQNTFWGTKLNQASIDAILVTINTAGTSNGRFNQSGGSAPSATGEAAITAMRSRGWTVTVTGGF